MKGNKTMNKNTSVKKIIAITIVMVLVLGLVGGIIIALTSQTPGTLESSLSKNDKTNLNKLYIGMTVDEITAVMGQPARIQETSPSTYVYELESNITAYLTVGDSLMDGVTLQRNDGDKETVELKIWDAKPE